MKKKTMFCLPFAGGTKTEFRDFKANLEDLVTVVPLEYSGHGARFSDPLIVKFTQAVEDVCSQIRSSCCCNYIIAGHSLGTALTYEIAYKMTNEYLNPPDKVILMAQKPPHLQSNDTRYRNRPKDEILQSIYEMGHIPNEIFADKELYDIFSEIIYADICLLNDYCPDITKEKLDIPFVAFTGKDDQSADYEAMKQWGGYSTKPMKLFEIEGGHFFPFDQKEVFFDVIRTVL